MPIYRVILEASYELDPVHNPVMWQEYIDQLEGNPETFEQRKWFLIDRLIGENTYDPEASLTVEKETRMG